MKKYLTEISIFQSVLRKYGCKTLLIWKNGQATGAVSYSMILNVITTHIHFP